MFGTCGESRGSRRKSASDKASVRKLCAFLVIMFGVCGESRGSRRKSITGTVSVTKLDRFFVVSGLAYMVRFARHLEQIYF